MSRSTDDRKRKSDVCRCSFCGRPAGQVDRLISSGCDDAFICAECVSACSELLAAEPSSRRPAMPPALERDLPKPHEVYETLNQYVVGQERAKRILSVAVYNHYKRISLGGAAGDVELQKSNVLLIGPTGCGKTLLARTLARILQVPFTIADATSLTEAGYVGEDVENILLKLWQAADCDLERAQKGIVYIDEIDKIARKSDSPSVTRDVSGEGVQQALLKILEGTTASVPPPGARKLQFQEHLQISSTNILFICGGTFEGLEAIIRERVREQPLGFAAAVSGAAAGDDDAGALLARALPEDLLRHGLIPEFVGRLPVVATLAALTEADLVRILLEPRNSLVKQYQKFLEWDGVELIVEPAAVEAIAGEALARKTGARGLRSIMEEVMLDIMYDLPSLSGVRRCVISEDTVRRRAAPVLEREDSERPRRKRAAG